MFLVTSKVRRRLLALLWADRVTGSANELAAAAGIGLASVYREVQEMVRHGLVTATHQGGRDVYAANRHHPAAGALEQVISQRDVAGPPDGNRRDRLYGQLRALGAPLPTEPRPLSRRADLEEVLVQGVKASHRDPRLARALPLCFWHQRHLIDAERLLTVAQTHREKNAVGFFLELTATLGKEPRVAQWASLFRDRRVRSRHFFQTPTSAEQRRLIELNTPELAREWGFRMNLDLAAFQTLFAKFDGVAS